MKTIQLYTKNNTWIAACMVNGLPDKNKIALFGTHHIPTPFTAHATFNEVKNEIQKRNPGAVITLS